MTSQQRGRSPNWKSPFEWTNDEVHDLVMKEVGVDETFATGFKLLLKLWVRPEYSENGTFIPETFRNNTLPVIGMLLGMGEDAFKDPYRFPSGPTHTYGEWCIFRPYEDQKIKKCGKHLLTFISDERLVGIEHNPATLESALRLEEDYKGGGG